MVRGTIRYLFIIALVFLLLGTAWHAATGQTQGFIEPTGPNAPSAKTIPTIAEALEFCKKAHKSLLDGYGDYALRYGMERIEPSRRASVAIICWAYGEGYLEGISYQHDPKPK